VCAIIACTAQLHELSAWAPLKLLDTWRRAADLLRVAAVHGQHEDLLGGLLFFTGFRKKSEPIA
jgi:hypothetical protein